MPISRARLPVTLSFLFLVAMVVSAIHAKALAPEVRKTQRPFAPLPSANCFKKRTRRIAIGSSRSVRWTLGRS